MNFIYPIKYKEIIEKYSEKYDVDKALVYAVIKCESSYKENARSSIGALGLMQITPETFEWAQGKMNEIMKYSDDDLYNPAVNIKYGIYLLHLHIGEFGNESVALAAYHAGRGSVNKWLNDKEYSDNGESLNKIPFGDTKKYVDRVIQTKEKYTKMYKLK